MTTEPRRRPPAALALAVLVGVVAAMAPAGAQDPSSTTTPPTTTTTVEPTYDPLLLDVDDPVQDEGVETDPVPVDPVQVPPSGVVPPPPSPEAQVVVQRELGAAQAQAASRRTSYASAREETIRLEAELDGIERRVSDLAGADRAAVRRVDAARGLFESRAIAATIRGSLRDVVPDVPTGDPNEIAAASALLAAVLDADQSALEDYVTARAATDADLLEVVDQLAATRTQLAAARGAMVDARRANVAAQLDLQVLTAGSDTIIRGFVFPVGDPHSFGNSFGAPRMMGTQHAHSHQGTDILAPTGTPLYACERGIVTKISNSTLGGLSFWIKGESGTYYYYAHLSRYADGLARGNLVEPGEVLGFVGDTGNAKGTPHLHFEIHPDGGAAVNPYPLLKVVEQLRRQVAAGPAPAASPSTTATPSTATTAAG